MPLYDYECDYCKKQFEVQMHMHDTNPVYCGVCNTLLNRLFSAPSIQYSYPTGHARSGRGGTGGSKPNAGSGAAGGDIA